MSDVSISGRVSDLISGVNTSGETKYLGFLTPSQSAEALPLLRNCDYKFFGGYENAERVYLSVMPEWYSEEDLTFPITAISFRYKEQYDLTHRDFLGALMSLGITRQSVGDILCAKGYTVAFVSSNISGHVLSGLQKIGNVGVDVFEGIKNGLPSVSHPVECTVTVSSLRLDAVVAAIAEKSRNVSCNMINTGLVTLNSSGADKITRTVSDGDVLSVRHCGKFRIISTDGRSKKGKIILRYTKY